MPDQNKILFTAKPVPATGAGFALSDLVNSLVLCLCSSINFAEIKKNRKNYVPWRSCAYLRMFIALIRCYRVKFHDIFGLRHPALFPVAR